MQISFNCDVQTVIFKNLNIFFLIFSSSGLDLFTKQLRPSSLYNPILLPPNLLFRMFKKYKPTNSYTSTPSKLPIVTSKFGLSFFTQISLLLNKSDFACISHYSFVKSCDRTGNINGIC